MRAPCKSMTALGLNPLLLAVLTVGLSAGNCVSAFAQESATPASPSGNFDGPAELPRVYVESSLRATPAPGTGTI